MADGVGQYRQRLEDIMRETAPPAPGALGTRENPYRVQGRGRPGDWWQRPATPPGRPGQFGFPQAELLPKNIEEIRKKVGEWENLPTGTLDRPEYAPQKSLYERFQGVFNVPGRGEDPDAPFNVGPRIGGQENALMWPMIRSFPPSEYPNPFTSPAGAQLAGSEVDLMGWRPAQEEAWSVG